ncbi:D-alanine-D-alanine ligase [Longilinea arvoryzae]|uniref:D-alanine--D-alanine ligase n=1 Tax=Longilinea arvoryzae TaxID=360412 RepID=A0A0S7BGK0_9CHLR|nr:D-alanine--D-alanine ligase family protein [Longilinea arvoryzae]GAP14272.1 D-alanine-D-alanine ligase [Longilinea arvoryzae]
MNNKIRIGILFGGRSGEHEVSLMSARSVLRALDPDRYEIYPIGITHAGQWLAGEDALDAFEKGKTGHLTPVTLLPQAGQTTLYAIQGQSLTPYADLDVIFPVLHGTFGEDGTIQGLFELIGLPYVGAGVLGSSVGMDKALFKDVMRANHIPVLDSIVLSRLDVEKGMEDAIAACEKVSAYPLFTKPANLGSSVGITKVRNRSDLYEGLLEAARFDRRVLVERGLEKPREIEVSVLGNDQPEASVPGEVRPSDDFYTYAAKYIDERSELIIPARLNEDEQAKFRSLAVAIFKAIDCAGMARVDFLYSETAGGIYVSEVNTIPGFTSISMFAKLWEASGISYPELIDRLVSLALERNADQQRTERQYRRSA